MGKSNFWKRWISMLLVLSMALGFIPINVFAKDSFVEENDITRVEEEKILEDEEGKEERKTKVENGEEKTEEETTLVEQANEEERIKKELPKNEVKNENGEEDETNLQSFAQKNQSRGEDWPADGSSLTSDLDLRALSIDAGGKIYTISGQSVTVTGKEGTTYTGLGFELSGGATLTLNNVSIDNGKRSATNVKEAQDKTKNYLQIPMVKAMDDSDNKLILNGKNFFTKTKMDTLTTFNDATGNSEEKKFWESTRFNPLIQVEKDSKLTIKGDGNLECEKFLFEDRTAVIGTRGKSTIGLLSLNPVPIR